MRELIKSMREATMKSGLLDSATGDLGQDLLDDQLALQMSGQPGGLSDLIARQLSQRVRARGSPRWPNTGTPGSTVAVPAASAGCRRPRQPGRLRATSCEVANREAQASGIPASFMLGQARHERLGPA